MKKFYIIMSGLLMQAGLLFGQSYLAPEEGYRVADFLSEHAPIGAFDIRGDRVYIQDGDSIHVIDASTGEEVAIYGEPADYESINYPSFLTVSPDAKSIWAGYTSNGNTDDRIYSIDIVSGEWSLKARFPGNYDLIFWKDSILVSGLNSATWGDPNGIYVLDTSGLDEHRLIIEVGGNSAGMALDTLMNMYYGTSYSMDPNAIYRWNKADLEAAIGTPGSEALQLSDGVKLTDVPGGISDCEIDAGFNLLFTMNAFGSPKILAMYKGNFEEGDGYLLDTLAVAAGEWDWLGSVRSMGDFTDPVIGERIVTFSFGKSLVDLHTADYPPFITGELPVISGYENTTMDTLDLGLFVRDPDDPDDFQFFVAGISDPDVADLQVVGDSLMGVFGKAGQANLVLLGISGEHEFELRTQVGSWPEMKGEFSISTMEELSLEPESYWNGSDESGGFSSASALFHNAYNPEWLFWSGWACSNVSDNKTPGWMNQYSAITGEGFDGSENYGVAYATNPSVITFIENKAHAVEGFFVSNSSYAALSMMYGDDFTKKFGGEEGSDPDFFRLDIWGSKGGIATDTLEFYLADFRSDSSLEDYILNTWQWVDLSSLGKVDSLLFGLASSDMGDWGMNTPGYFCLDHLHVLPDAAPYVANPLEDFILMSDGRDTILDLGPVFSDPDDPDDSITLSILSNSNEDLLKASLDGKELTLSGKIQLLKSTYEEIELVVEGKSGGLTAMDTLVVSLDWPGGINDLTGANISLFPNPNRGSFVIQSDSPQKLDVTIFSMTGTRVYENPDFVRGQEVDLQELPSGPYIVRIRKDSKVFQTMIQKL
jgi:hypothetical protein